MFDQRLKTFAQKLKDHNLDGFIITNPVNIFYLCGFKGISQTEREATLIFTNSKAYLITASLYQTEARRLSSSQLSIRIVKERNQIFEFVKKLFKVGLPTDSAFVAKATSAKEAAQAKVGFEEQNLTVAELKEFKKALPKAKLVACKNFIEDMRIIKTEDEIKKIEKAQIISQKAFGALLKTIKIGQTEAEIADRLSKIIKDEGGQGLAFESIVAAGPNSARPHYLTGKGQ